MTIPNPIEDLLIQARSLLSGEAAADTVVDDQSLPNIDAKLNARHDT